MGCTVQANGDPPRASLGQEPAYARKWPRASQASRNFNHKPAMPASLWLQWHRTLRRHRRLHVRRHVIEYALDRGKALLSLFGFAIADRLIHARDDFFHVEWMIGSVTHQGVFEDLSEGGHVKQSH